MGFIPEMRDLAELRYFFPHLHLTPFLLLSTLSFFFRNFYEISVEFSGLYRGGELTTITN
jgi:hypothetical protein